MLFPVAPTTDTLFKATSQTDPSKAWLDILVGKHFTVKNRQVDPPPLLDSSHLETVTLVSLHQ